MKSISFFFSASVVHQDYVVFPWITVETFYFFRGREREKERERNIDVHTGETLIGCLSYARNMPDPHPRHMPRLGMEPATFQFAGGRSIH